MIQHIWAQAKLSRLLDEVFIACDHERVLKAAEGFKARAILTSPDHPSGTDRVAEVAAAMDTDIVLNIQGDEPLLQPKIIDGLAEVMLDDPTLLMATVIKRITRKEELTNPNVVKVVVDRDRNLLFASTIPYNREKNLPKRFITNISASTPIAGISFEFQKSSGLASGRFRKAGTVTGPRSRP